jgi:hypothetical protein
MLQIVLIGLASGVASALLFASVASGSLFSVLLFYLSPLPIMIAAIGWSHWAGLLGALLAAVLLGSFLGSFFFLAFSIAIGFPAWSLGYLALMARPTSVPATLEWYPIGRLVLWAAMLGALVVVLVIPSFGFDAETVQRTLKQAFERIIRIQMRVPADAPLEIPGLSDPNRLIDFLVIAIPPTAAVLATVTNLLNLWLAGRIVKVSGRLRRPWPDLSAMTFPGYAPVLLAVMIAGTFLTGLTGMITSIFAASLLMAYVVLGFAVLHMITRRINSRGLLLAAAYAAVAIFGWPVLLMMVLGLADTAIDIRGRFAKKGVPPAAGT